MRAFWDRVLPWRRRGSDQLQISFIIPFFASHDRLEACLQSVKSQCSLTHEIILVDDGNTGFDFSAATAIPGVRLLKMPKNRGEGASRTAGLKAARGEFTLFLDSDDEIIGDPAEYLKALDSVALEKADVDIITGHLVSAENKRDTIQTHPQLTSLDAELAIIKINSFTAHLYRTRFLHENDLTFSTDTTTAADAVFLARTLPKARKILKTNVTIYRYNVVEGSMSRRPVTFDQFHQRFGVAAIHIANALLPYPAPLTAKGSVIFKYAVLQVKGHPDVATGQHRNQAFTILGALARAFSLSTDTAKDARMQAPVFWNDDWDRILRLVEADKPAEFFEHLETAPLRLTRWH